MNLILLGGIAGIGAGSVLLFLSHITPRFHAGHRLPDPDLVRLPRRTASRRESHLLGMAIHLATSFLFGALYASFAQFNMVDGYRFIPLAIYTLLITLFTGGVVMPLEGHGLFGIKEDRWFVVDLLITNIAWTAIYWFIMALWV